MTGLTIAQQQAIERVWNHLVCLMQEDHVSVVEIPMEIKTAIGQDGVDTLVTRFGEFIQGTPAMTEVTEGETKAIRIAPAHPIWGFSIIPGAPPAKANETKNGKPPRPPNAFIIYRQYYHPWIKQNFPELNNNQISVMIGKQWQNEDDMTKAVYKKMADEIKKKHAIIWPNYHYQPRKPTEKKHRMTRRKGEELPVVPEVRKNNAGNPIITLGDVGIADAAFQKMLENYNKSVTAQNPNASVHGTAIFTNHTKESQESFTIYQAQLDGIIDNSPTDDDIEAEFNRAFASVDMLDEDWSNLSPKKQANEWDEIHGNASQGGFGRSNTVFDV